MNCTSLLLCLLVISISNAAQARSARRLEGEGIIGGDNAEKGQFPYQISVEFFGRSICGGSILDERYVITAAHCVMGDDGRFNRLPLKAVGGVVDLKSKSDQNRVAVDVIGVYVPREYDQSDRRVRRIGDIAILKLNKDLGIKANRNLKKVKLPEKDETYVGVEATISGFGWNTVDLKTYPIANITIETGGDSDDKMRYAKATVITNVECQKNYRKPLVEKHMCAAVLQRSKSPEGICSGDSGGPLVYEGVQIGVVSTSPTGCREDVKAAVYTRVSKYVDFIRKVVDDRIDGDIRTHTLKPFPDRFLKNRH